MISKIFSSIINRRIQFLKQFSLDNSQLNNSWLNSIQLANIKRKFLLISKTPSINNDYDITQMIKDSETSNN